MNIRRAAVFGASGKVGRHVCAALRRRGITVRAMVHSKPLEDPSIESVQGSVTEANAVNATVRGADVVIQMATTKEDREGFFDVSLRGTFNMLEACREFGVQQFLLLGGDAAMGIWYYPQPIPIDENHPLTAYPGYYAFSKVIEESMANQYAIQYGVPVSILRASWIFDTDDLLNHFSLLKNVKVVKQWCGLGGSEEIQRLAEAGEERIPVLTAADGTPLYRHIVHIDDVIQAFEKMLGNSVALGQSFNIAGPSPFNYRVAGEYLWRATGIPTMEIAQSGIYPFEINITKARMMLHYKPENDFFRMADRALEVRASVNGACSATATSSRVG